MSESHSMSLDLRNKTDCVVDVDTIVPNQFPATEHHSIDNSHEPVCDSSEAAPILSCHNLQYTIELSKKLVEKIPHSILRVTQVAIMGQSGAGKTTLLNILAQRASGNISGRIVVNGRALSRSKAKRILGYVHQQDEHFSELTVLESLQFIAGLTMPSSTNEERMERIMDVMCCLNLVQIQHSLVGNTSGSASMARGISGGERKRLSIAGALIHNPHILLLDEYTSGLDSEMALEVTNLLKDLAKRGRTIICTIHQPSSQIFYSFDKLHLLTQGRTVYFGKTDEVVAYFDALGKEYVCPPYFNPAEHVQRLAFSNGYGKKNFVLSLVEVFLEHPKNQLLQKTAKYLLILSQIDYGFLSKKCGVIGNQHLDSQATSRRDSKVVENVAKSSLSQQFAWLCWRNFRLLYRNKLKTKVKLIMNIVLGIVFGTIYFDVPNTNTGISDRNFFILQFAIVVGVRQTMETLTFFLREKVVYLRQVEQGLYGVLPYLSSRFIVEMPQMMVFPLVFCIISLPMVGLNYENENFIIFWAAIVTLILNAYSFGLAIGTLITDPDILSIISAAFNLTFYKSCRIQAS
eukprot:gene2483-5413_t